MPPLSRSLACSALALFAAAACTQYPLQPARNGADNAVNVRYQFERVQGTDVLFVVDTSNSMEDKQKQLIANAEDFLQELSRSANPFRIGIVSTDTQKAQDGGRLRKLRGNQRWLEAPDANDPELESKRRALISDFRAGIANVGIQGDGRESGLAMALVAVGALPAEQAAGPAVDAAAVARDNQGFLRQSADLAVIILSDEDDCSRAPASVAANRAAVSPYWCYDPAKEAERLAPAEAAQRLAQVKGNDVRRVRAAVIAAGVTGKDGKFVPNSCRPDGRGGATDQCGCWSRAGATDGAFYCDAISAEGQSCELPGSRPPPAGAKPPSCRADSECIDPTQDRCLPLCASLGGRRYQQFLTALDQQRGAAQAVAGTQAASICMGDYSETLLQIASDVVAPRCYKLPAAAKRPQDVGVLLRRNGADNVLGSEETLERFAPGEDAACNSCGDCAKAAWRMASPDTVCLACGLLLHPGDVLRLQVLSASENVPPPKL